VDTETDLIHLLRGRGVYETSQGRFDVIESIREHLLVLLNTRRGSVSHLPLYGLPFLPDIFKDLPKVIPELQNTIKQNIRLFEPRIAHVEVHLERSQEWSFRLKGTLRAVVQLPHGHRELTMQTFISNVGEVLFRGVDNQ
jgi:type VI secretion system lysozyme-like protein